jgi:hypothetical protein
MQAEHLRYAPLCANGNASAMAIGAIVIAIGILLEIQT